MKIVWREDAGAQIIRKVEQRRRLQVCVEWVAEMETHAPRFRKLLREGVCGSLKRASGQSGPHARSRMITA